MVREVERQTGRITGIIISVLSLVTFIGSFSVTSYFYDGFISYNSEYLIIAILIIPLWYIGIIQSHLTHFNNKGYLTIIVETGLFVITGTGFLALTQVAFNLTQVNNYVILTYAILDFILLNVILLLTFRYNKKLAEKGINIENIILIADANSVDFIEKISQHKEWGYNINTIISDSPIIDEIFGSRVRVIKDVNSLGYILRQEVIDEVLYCKNSINQDEIKEMIYTCEEIGVIFKLQSSFFHMSSTKTNLTYYEGTPFLTFANTPSVKFTHN